MNFIRHLSLYVLFLNDKNKIDSDGQRTLKILICWHMRLAQVIICVFICKKFNLDIKSRKIFVEIYRHLINDGINQTAGLFLSLRDERMTFMQQIRVFSFMCKFLLGSGKLAVDFFFFWWRSVSTIDQLIILFIMILLTKRGKKYICQW